MKIKHISSSIPEDEWTADRVAKACGADETFIKNKVGLKTRYFLKAEQSGVSLAYDACIKLFQEAEIKPCDIELLVFVTQTPDQPLPQNSSKLQDKLGIPTSCASFDVSLGCSGFVYGISIVKSMMDSLGMSKALLVTCDPYSKVIDISDKNTNAVFGDAATATLMSDDGSLSIGIPDFGTNGKQSEAIRVDPYAFVDDEENILRYGKLSMSGRDVFNFVVSEIPSSIRKCLKQNKLSIQDIDYFALHQGSKYMLEYMAKKVGIPMDNLLINIDKYGNTVSSTIPLLLEELLKGGNVKTGSYILISGFGVGLSWATNILEFNNE